MFLLVLLRVCACFFLVFLVLLLSKTALSRTALSWIAVPPKFSLFFHSPATIFFLSSLSLGGPFVEFRWCLKRRGPEMCTFVVLGLSCTLEGPGGPAGASHDSPRPHTCTCQGPGLQKHHQNSTKGPPRERERKLWRKGKKREILGPPPFGAPPFGAPLCLPKTKDGRVGGGDFGLSRTNLFESNKGPVGLSRMGLTRINTLAWPKSNWPESSAPGQKRSGLKAVRPGAGQKRSPFWAFWGAKIGPKVVWAKSGKKSGPKAVWVKKRSLPRRRSRSSDTWRKLGPEWNPSSSGRGRNRDGA